MPPLFTIAIPTYNRAALLAEALQSALAQTFDDYEIVVRDNASTDGTAELVRGHPSPRLRHYRNEENVGWHRNFDLLAQDAQGEYLVYLQDDDLLRPDFLARAARALQGRPDVALYAAYLAGAPSQSPQCWDLKGLMWGPELPSAWDQSGPRYWPGPLASVQCLVETGFFIPAVAMRTDLCRKHLPWDPALGNAADRLLTGRVAAEGRAAVDPWVGGIMRFHPGQATHQYGDCTPYTILAAEKLLAFYEARSIDWRALVREWLANLSPERRWKWLGYVRAGAYPKALQETIASALPELAVGESDPLAHRRLAGQVKDFARAVTPPLLWRFARRLAGAS
jgi:glycosyltransferase involved in cell wall biosynthesis